MSMSVLAAIEAIEAVMNLAMQAGVNVARYRAMKEENGGEPLTDAQREQLLADSQSAINRLPEGTE